jgi:hypothetical protein
MAPKKKDEEVKPEELLPAGFSIGGQVFWCEPSGEVDGLWLKCGTPGTLTQVHVCEDVQTVDVQFSGLERPLAVGLHCVSPSAPPDTVLDELSTNLKLPLRGCDVQRVWDASDFATQERLLRELLHISDRDPRQQLLVDYSMFNLYHARRTRLTPFQGAVFHAVMDRMLQMLRAPVIDAPDERNLKACLQEFQRLLLQHYTRNPPEQLDIFTGDTVKSLTDFATSTLFKHFLLYQYCMNHDREVQTLRRTLCIETPLPPPDLCAAQRAREPPEQRPPVPEPDEIDRLVQEKLLETEKVLDLRLEERETNFRQRLAERDAEAASAPKKGRK